MNKYIKEIHDKIKENTENINPNAYIKELNAMDDKTLADIGIRRCDIDSLIWLEQDKKRRGTNAK